MIVDMGWLLREVIGDHWDSDDSSGFLSKIKDRKKFNKKKLFLWEKM